jgi:serine/threonine-protein kinase
MSERTPVSSGDDPLLGTCVGGKYNVLCRIGRGGMGAVYEAEHDGIGKKVALKVIEEEWAKDELVVSRFAREARVISSIESEHIVTVFDAGSEAGRPFLVMELLRGEDLGSRLRRLGRLPVGEALHVIAQVLRGLADAHEAGIVHRDLKPDNVFLIERGGDPLFAKILDFGISKIEKTKAGTAPLALTQKGIVLGTPFYMPPEQAQALDVDARSDLYGAGAILFECLSGRPPHTGETYEQVIVSICMRDAPDLRAIVPNIPDDVAGFVARALSRDREGRFPSATAMLAALRELAPEDSATRPLSKKIAATLASEGPRTDVSWTAGSLPRVSEAPPQRKRSVVGATAVIATLAGVGITFGFLSLSRTDPAPPPQASQPQAPQPSATAARTEMPKAATRPAASAEQAAAVTAPPPPPTTTAVTKPDPPKPRAAPPKPVPLPPPATSSPPAPQPKKPDLDIDRELPK